MSGIINRSVRVIVGCDHGGRILRGLLTKNNVQRCLSSSAFSGLVPESVREAVKSTILEEATKPESKLWGDDYDRRIIERQRQNEAGRHVNGNHEVGTTNANGSSINDAINGERIDLLDDPLTEWHLDRSPGRPQHSLPSGVRPLHDGADPFELSKRDMERLSGDIRRDLIGSDHPVLSMAASYFFETGQDGGKKIRPMMVLLLSRTIAESAPSNEYMSENANMPFQRSDLAEAQRRLAEITEMIHTASLFHDDVIDGAETRRSVAAVHQVFGNKVAILAGDYLLARASVYLARLRDVEVVETMSTIIGHLVRGEVMQMRGNGTSSKGFEADAARERMSTYLRKTFYKTGSLMANSCKSAAILGGYSDAVISASYRYGKHVGMAFQLVDDVLDFDGSEALLGKPALADLNAGLSTAPVLFAAETFSNELIPLMERKFREPGDVDRALEMVRRSEGIQRARNLALVHAELAIDAIMELEPSCYRDSLVHLAYAVVSRKR